MFSGTRVLLSGILRVSKIFVFGVFLIRSRFISQPQKLTGKLYSVRWRSSTPINTVVMFVPQQEVCV